MKPEKYKTERPPGGRLLGEVGLREVDLLLFMVDISSLPGYT